MQLHGWEGNKLALPGCNNNSMLERVLTLVVRNLGKQQCGGVGLLQGCTGLLQNLTSLNLKCSQFCIGKVRWIRVWNFVDYLFGKTCKISANPAPPPPPPSPPPPPASSTPTPAAWGRSNVHSVCGPVAWGMWWWVGVGVAGVGARRGWQLRRGVDGGWHLIINWRVKGIYAMEGQPAQG
jgi:hypothetical protein